MEYSRMNKLPEGHEIMSVGLGMCKGQEVVILSVNKLPGGSVTVNVIDLDMSTKREVPQEDVTSFYIKKGNLVK